MARKPPKRTKTTAAQSQRRGGPPPSTTMPTIAMPGAKSARDLELNQNVRAAIAAYGVQEFDRAEKILTKVLAADPSHRDALRERSFVRSRGLQDIDGAETDLDAALALKTDAPDALRKGGSGAIGAGLWTTRRRSPKDAIALAPDHANAYSLLARIKGANAG